MKNLMENDVGKDVQMLQQLLQLAGAFPGMITGSFGSETTAAVKYFQSEHNLKADGIVGPETWDKLFVVLESYTPEPLFTTPRPTLKLGDTGEAVGELQTILVNLSYYNGPVNRIFGSSTESAVRSFQLVNKLLTDGVVGRSTWGALHNLFEPLAICGGGVTSPPTGVIHTVVAGDTLYSIARQHNTTVDDLRRLNNLTSDILRIGQQLIVSEGGVTTETIHTVVAGDTLWTLAARYNTTVSAIKSLNGLTSDALRIGQQLRIPGSASYAIHTVVAGDTLWALAARYNTTVAAIRSLNGLTSDALRIGQQLRIPK